MDSIHEITVAFLWLGYWLSLASFEKAVLRHRPKHAFPTVSKGVDFKPITYQLASDILPTFILQIERGASRRLAKCCDVSRLL